MIVVLMVGFILIFRGFDLLEYPKTDNPPILGSILLIIGLILVMFSLLAMVSY